MLPLVIWLKVVEWVSGVMCVMFSSVFCASRIFWYMLRYFVKLGSKLNIVASSDNAYCDWIIESRTLFQGVLVYLPEKCIVESNL